MSRGKRPTRDYLTAASQLTKFVPGLKRYRRRKTLLPWEKAHIARYEKKLRYAHHLIPLTPAQAKRFKPFLFGRGINAIQLSNTGDVKIKSISKINGDMMLASNGRQWIYWRLDRDTVRSRKGMQQAAQDAFDMQFPIEKIAALAEKAFEELKPYAVYLWASVGRVGEGFQTIKQFVDWLYANWNSGRYSMQERWVNGLAIRIT